MTGTILNTATVLAGSALGLLLHRRLSRAFEDRMLQAMGVFTLALGFSMFIKVGEPLVALIALVAGGALGTWWGLTGRINRLGDGIKELIRRMNLKVSERFTEGFVTASILFCVGPMTILGSLNDGLKGDYELLAIKSAMDFVGSFALAAVLGWGVTVSALTILLVQGGLTLSARWLGPLLSDERVAADLTGLGGLIILIIGFKLARLGKWEPADFLPALVLAPALTWAWLRLFPG